MTIFVCFRLFVCRQSHMCEAYTTRSQAVAWIADTASQQTFRN